MSNFDETHKRTIAVYDKFAEGWDKHRPRLLREKTWLKKFIQSLPSNASVLDVGCGAGEPISKFLVDQGFSVTGLDSSQAMIGICRYRFPNEAWLVMDMREIALDKQFDGIIAWDSFFHLKPDEQRNTLRLFSEHLRPRGSLLLTIGHEAGEVLGTVEGEAVYHSSLSAEEYRHILGSAGFQNIEIVLSDESCDRSVLLASQYGCC